MRTVLILAVLIAVLLVAAGVFFRLVAMPPEVWDVEPSEVTPPDTPNFVLLAGEDAPVFSGSLAQAAAVLERAAEADGATRIAGDLSEGHATYVVRTPLMGFPDAVSIRLRPEGEGVAIEIFSRSRYGYSDMGVNAARVARWTAPLLP